MRASGAGRWLLVALVIHLVLASLVLGVPSEADNPLQASLEYSIQPNAYNNSVRIGGAPIARLAVDRDPVSHFYGAVYAIGTEGNGSCNNNTGGSQLEVTRSLDGGQTFGTPTLSSFCLGSEGVDAAVGRNGTLFVASDRGVFRSVDGGQSWNLSLAANALSITADNTTGDVYAATIDAAGRLSVSSTLDAGASWSKPVNVPTSYVAWSPAIAAFRHSVVVAFLQNEFQPSILVAASQDRGLTWPNVTVLSPGGVSAGPPSADASPSGVFGVSWSEYAAGNANASPLVSVSHDGGQTFSNPVQPGGVPGPTGGVGHALAFDDASRLYVTWPSLPNRSIPGSSTNPNYSSSIYVAISPNYGESFENASFNITLTGEAANLTQIESLAAGPNDTMFLTWMNGTLDRGFESVLRTVSGQARGEIALTTQPAGGTSLEFVLRDQLTAAVQARVPWNRSTLVLDGLPPSVYDVWIEVANASAKAGPMPVRTWGRTSFTVRVEGVPGGPGAPPFPWATAATAGTIVVFVAAALLSLQHTRLLREAVLQRKVRLLLYETIQGEPGSSFTEVRNAVGLRNGVAAYHLKVLERQGFVHTEKGRHHRWYYPNGDVSLWRDQPLSALQKSLVEQVRQDPGIGIREIARSLNRHHASVAYNVRGLAREGVLRTKRTGRKVHCFLSDESGAE